MGKTTVILSPYSIHWPEEFASLSQVISQKLGKECLAIEHVGSTAVPGIFAKPILDVDVVIQSYEVLSEVALRLHELGYSHQGDLGIPNREAFKRHDDEVPWTLPRRKWTQQNLYVCPIDSAELRRHVRFRDILRSRDDLALDYERQKMEIAARSKGDRRLYAQIKEVECRKWIYELLEEKPPLTP